MSRAKLSVRLFHGRNDPDERLDDWGFDGPCLGPVDGVAITYGTIRLLGESYELATLPMVDDLILYDGKLYGDADIGNVRAQPPTEQVDERLADAATQHVARTPIPVPKKLIGEYRRRVEVFVDSIRELAGDRAAQAASRALAQVAPTQR